MLALAPAWGVSVVVDESYGPKDADVTPQLTKVRWAAEADALFVFGTGQGPAVATRKPSFSINGMQPYCKV